MDAETLRTTVTSTITAISTLGAAAIVGYWGYRTQRQSNEMSKLKEANEKLRKELSAAYGQVSAYYQLEQAFADELCKLTGDAQKTLKSRFRDAVEEKGFCRPELTTNGCNSRIAALDG